MGKEEERLEVLFSRVGRFEAGPTDAVAAVNAVLALNFALAAGEDNPNELPDAPTRVGA